MSRTVAEGRLQKLVLLVLAAAVVIGVGTWYPGFSQGYEVKTAGKLACNEHIKAAKGKISVEEMVVPWREPFLRRCSVAGVKLKPTQYTFAVTHDRNAGEFVCKSRIEYPLKMDWAFIGDIFSIAPIETKKVLTFEHRVRDAY